LPRGDALDDGKRAGIVRTNLKKALTRKYGVSI
jgi:hypothetical protein